MLDTEIGENRFRFVGDVHLGKVFQHGVPLHRRGEREAWVWTQFADEITRLPSDRGILVQVGDIFDKFVVPLSVILRAAEYIRTAVAKNPGWKFIFIRGNHDGSRDRDKASAFDVLKELLSDLKAVHVLTDATILYGVAFLPWDPFVSAAEMAAKIDKPVLAVVGHWDIDTFGGPTHNLIPTNDLSTYTKLAYSGHDHTPAEFDRDGVRCIYVGSMQPYTHKEDKEGKIYITCTIDELPLDITDKCVRLILKPGELPPDDLDCLQLQIVRQGEDEKDEAVVYEAFDFSKLWDEAFAEASVPAELKQALLEKYRETANT